MVGKEIPQQSWIQMDHSRETANWTCHWNTSWKRNWTFHKSTVWKNFIRKFSSAWFSSQNKGTCRSLFSFSCQLVFWFQFVSWISFFWFGWGFWFGCDSRFPFRRPFAGSLFCSGFFRCTGSSCLEFAVLALQFFPIWGANHFLWPLFIMVFCQMFCQLVLFFAPFHPLCQRLWCSAMLILLIQLPPNQTDLTLASFTNADTCDSFDRMIVVNQSVESLLLRHTHVEVRQIGFAQNFFRVWLSGWQFLLFQICVFEVFLLWQNLTVQFNACGGKHQHHCFFCGIGHSAPLHDLSMKGVSKTSEIRFRLADGDAILFIGDQSFIWFVWQISELATGSCHKIMACQSAISTKLSSMTVIWVSFFRFCFGSFFSNFPWHQVLTMTSGLEKSHQTNIFCHCLEKQTVHEVLHVSFPFQQQGKTCRGGFSKQCVHRATNFGAGTHQVQTNAIQCTMLVGNPPCGRQNICEQTLEEGADSSHGTELSPMAEDHNCQWLSAVPVTGMWWGRPLCIGFWIFWIWISLHHTDAAMGQGVHPWPFSHRMIPTEKKKWQRTGDLRWAHVRHCGNHTHTLDHPLILPPQWPSPDCICPSFCFFWGTNHGPWWFWRMGVLWQIQNHDHHKKWNWLPRHCSAGLLFVATDYEEGLWWNCLQSDRLELEEENWHLCQQQTRPNDCPPFCVWGVFWWRNWFLQTNGTWGHSICPCISGRLPRNLFDSFCRVCAHQKTWAASEAIHRRWILGWTIAIESNWSKFASKVRKFGEHVQVRERYADLSWQGFYVIRTNSAALCASCERKSTRPVLHLLTAAKAPLILLIL